jgi:phosphogluconate dehydratase
VRDGDPIRLDADASALEVLVPLATLHSRVPLQPAPMAPGCGRELFAAFRDRVGTAEGGASSLQ